MAVHASLCGFVLEFGAIGPLKGIQMASTADIALFALKKALVISRVW